MKKQYDSLNSNINPPIIEEITLRSLPYDQKKEEIIEYCRIHKRVLMSEIANDLRLNLGDVYEIINELIDDDILGVRNDYSI